jgi:hypothetical protein
MDQQLIVLVFVTQLKLHKKIALETVIATQIT